MLPKLTLLTVGHSTHSWEQFERLIKLHDVTGIADVRSAPYSRRFPHFDSDALKISLRDVGIAYSFLGLELGGRPRKKSFYCDGIADYEKMSDTSEFRKGITRVIDGARKYRIALLCSEHDPLTCHRCLLVARQLDQRGVDIEHILSDGSLQSQKVLEQRLLENVGQRDDDLFSSAEERIAAAYRFQSRKVAYSLTQQSSAAR